MFPKIEHPIFEIKLTSLDKPIKYRQYLSKEEKILLMALSGGDKEEISNAVKQVINNCVVTPGFDIDKLPSFDLEYMFLTLRAKSVGQTVKIKFRGRESNCPTCAEDKDISIDLETIKVQTIEGHSKKIKITDKIGVVMKYPTRKEWQDLLEFRNNYDVNLQYKLVASCIDFIYDQNETYEVTPENLEQAIKWLEENTSSTQFDEIWKFFDTMPRLKHVVDLSCEKCGHKEEFVLEGIENFFM